MSPPSAFEPVHIIPPATPHTHTIIALHGRGSQGPEFAEELFEGKTSSGLTLQESFPSWKWVFPSSQERFSTVFQEELDEWFDIYSLTDPSQREELQVEGLRDSISFVRGIIREEARTVSPGNIILLGISQGSATGIIALLASQLQLGAYIGLSGWLPFASQLSTQQPLDLATFFETTLSLQVDSAPTLHPLTTPIFLGHTSDDGIIDIELGRQTRAVLEKMGMPVTWREHAEGGHLGFLDTKGLDDIVAFLKEVYGDI